MLAKKKNYFIFSFHVSAKVVLRLVKILREKVNLLQLSSFHWNKCGEGTSARDRCCPATGNAYMSFSYLWPISTLYSYTNGLTDNHYFCNNHSLGVHTAKTRFVFQHTYNFLACLDLQFFFKKEGTQSSSQLHMVHSLVQLELVFFLRCERMCICVGSAGLTRINKNARGDISSRWWT